MDRQLVIGDLHGSLKALQQVLDIVKITKDDTLIFLGDYVDGWSDSSQLIEYLIQLSYEYNCIYIKGNHDKWCESWLTTGIKNVDWVNHGGHTTLKSYNDTLLSNDKSHIMFFYKLHKYYIDDKNRLFVHGGYKTTNGVIGEVEYNLLWDRDLFTNAFNMSLNGVEDTKMYDIYEEIFVGHTTTLFYSGDSKPINALNVWNLDTGAGTNGRVTVMDVDTKEYWQSDLVRDIYPNDPHIEFCNKFLK